MLLITGLKSDETCEEDAVSNDAIIRKEEVQMDLDLVINKI